MLSLFLRVILILISFDVFAQQDSFICNKKNAQQFSTHINDVLKNKILALGNIIEGKPAEIAVAHIWGKEINFDSTDAQIKNFEDKLEDDQFVLPEHQQLSKCLKKLKKETLLNTLTLNTRELIQLQIKYLKKNKEVQNLLNASSQTSSGIPTLRNQVDQEKAQVEQLKNDIQKEVLLSEVKLAETQDTTEKEIIAYKAQLKKIKLEIIKVNEMYVNSLEKHLEEFEKQTIVMATVTAKLKDLSGEELISEFQLVSSVWEKVILDAFKQIQTEASKFDFPEVPAIPKVLKNVADESKTNLMIAYNEVVDLKNKSIREVTAKKNQEVEVQNNLLLQVNLVRSELYKEIPLSYLLNEIFSKRFWELIKIEVIASPYRVISFFFGKYLYLKEQVSQGYAGFRKLGFELVVFLFLTLLFLGAHRLFNLFSERIDRFIKVIVINYKKSKLFKYTSRVWFKLKDSSVDFLWIVTLLGIQYSDFLNAFVLVIEFFIIIFQFRILKRLVEVGLGIIAAVDSHGYMRFKTRALQTSNSVGKVFLFYALSMLFLESVLGKTYIYSLINITTLGFAVSLFVRIATDWEIEITNFLEKNISGIIVEKIQKTTGFLPNRLKAITHLIFLTVFSFFNLFIYLTEDFEISKKISANIFKNNWKVWMLKKRFKMSFLMIIQQDFH